MISFHRSFEIINVIVPDLNISSSIAVSVTDIVLLIVIVLNQIYLMVSIHFSIKTIQRFLMVLKVNPQTLLIVQFYASDFLIILC